MHLLWPAAMATRDICYNRAWLEAFRDYLGLQIIRPLLSAYSSIHFDTRRQWSSYVVRIAVHCENPCRRRQFIVGNTFLAKEKNFASLTPRRRIGIDRRAN